MPKLKLIPSPKSAPGAEEHARAETERKWRLFAWADQVLHELGLPERVAQASSKEELCKVTFDPNAVEVELAIRDALHPASGPKDDCFTGIHDGGLKRLLKKRFDAMKMEREAELRDCVTGAARSASDWTDDLKLDDKGGVRPALANLILFLRNHPKWKGVLEHHPTNPKARSISHGFSSDLRQQAKVSRPPGRSAVRRFVKARAGSAKNITPNRENSRSKAAGLNR
jgi:hypothetical protein